MHHIYMNVSSQVLFYNNEMLFNVKFSSSTIYEKGFRKTGVVDTITGHYSHTPTIWYLFYTILLLYLYKRIHIMYVARIYASYTDWLLSYLIKLLHNTHSLF